jgi:aminocarboxymuconate-semialdehyde decarboxylase
MVGAEIATTVDGRELDDLELAPFWSAAEELRAVVVVHPYASLAGRNVSRYNLNNLVGNPAETTIAVAHLVHGGVLERHPGLRVVLVHGGGFAPFQMGRWDRGFSSKADGAEADLTRPPSDWLRQMWFDTVLHSPASLRFLVDVVGVEHVVLGSDYPFRMGDPDPVATVRAVGGLAGKDLERVLSGNLATLLEEVRR